MTNKISHDSETLADGQQVITACAFIHQKFNGIEKVFLPKRATTKKFLPDVYELPGGHINYREDIVDGLKREIMEEFNMKVRVGDPFAVFTYNNDIKKSHSIEVIYFAEFSDPIENIKIHPEDHSCFDWVGENELDKVYTENKKSDDPEMQSIQKGFKILNGESPAFN
ncbi:MAG: NUDIX hydrolase [Candidatus Paceibacterota bacterium]|jgi:8-oxo-dGTP pyrophosphatase MutT (NUDIX family)